MTNLKPISLQTKICPLAIRSSKLNELIRETLIALVANLIRQSRACVEIVYVSLYFARKLKRGVNLIY